MYKIIKRIDEAVPILHSPIFWGIVLLSVVTYLKADGFITDNLASMLQTITGAATGVKIIHSTASKL